MDINKQSKIFITCGLELGQLLRGEVEQLGFTVENQHGTGVEITGTIKDAMTLNLYLRCAFNVHYLLKEFECVYDHDLYRELSEVPWEDIVDPDGYISVTSSVNTDSIDNANYANTKAKDAIVDRLMNKFGKRPDSGSQRNKLVFALYWKKHHCRFYLNTSGVKLTDRGYRRIPFKAPMRESLAAGVVLSTGYDGSATLVNPMCGSGTIAIEAALIASCRACGLLRSNFSFMHAKGFDPDVWKQLRVDARKQGNKQKPKTIAPIIATDIDPKAIEAARKNAMTAGVDQMIDFKVCDFAETTIPGQGGIVILNPEYGQRLGEIKELEETYARIGDFFKQSCAGYTGYIFTGNMNLAKKVGLRTKSRKQFFNSNIECRLLEYELYAGTRKNSDNDNKIA